MKFVIRVNQNGANIGVSGKTLIMMIDGREMNTRKPTTMTAMAGAREEPDGVRMRVCSVDISAAKSFWGTTTT